MKNQTVTVTSVSVTFSLIDSNGATHFDTCTFDSDELAIAWITQMQTAYGNQFRASRLSRMVA